MTFKHKLSKRLAMMRDVSLRVARVSAFVRSLPVKLSPVVEKCDKHVSAIHILAMVRRINRQQLALQFVKNSRKERKL
jgi:hypothetical protein